VTVAVASAAPELDSTPNNKITDDLRSFVFDGAVRSVPDVVEFKRQFNIKQLFIHKPD